MIGSQEKQGQKIWSKTLNKECPIKSFESFSILIDKYFFCGILIMLFVTHQQHTLLQSSNIKLRFNNSWRGMKKHLFSCPYQHCKDTIPKIRNKYSQERNCATTVPILTLMFQWAIDIFWSACLFCCRKIGGPNVELYRSLTDTVNVEMGTESAQFLFWEYINPNFCGVNEMKIYDPLTDTCLM